MDINTALSYSYSVWNIASFVLAVIGALSLIAVAIGAFTRLGKAGWRFGLALFGKRIMIVADNNDYSDLEEDLSDSGLIKKKNIQHISDKQLHKATRALLMIIVSDYLCEADFKRVINGKDPRCGLIIYCPPDRKRITDDEMMLLSHTAFSVLCNFRGRLVNDVLLTMLSTSFKKSDLKEQQDQNR